MKNFFKRIKYLLLSKKGLFFSRFADSFYTFQQEKLRGSIDEIKKRQTVYLKYIKKLPKTIRSKHFFLDIGFGRGEFLNILQKNKFKKLEGVDTNKNYVLSTNKKGITVYHDDGIRYLYLSQKKFYGISAFHLIEHIEFIQLFDLLVLCQKKLVKGGILILETPNVENIGVGSSTFYLDYTHKLKLPSLLLRALLEYLGFNKIEFLYLHPNEHGAQDLGVIAYK